MVNFLDSFLSIFSKQTSNSVVGVDIGSSSIKVVELKKRKEKAILQTYGEIALGPYTSVEVGQSTKLDPSKISEALVDVLKEANTSTSSSAIAIPMSSSMVSIFRMPKMNDKQLGQMIPVESRKYIPVPISEVTLDWFVIPTTKNDDQEEVQEKPKKVTPKDFIEVMVVAIHNDVLSNINNIVGSTTLTPSFFEVEMFSTIRSTIDSVDNASVMIVDIGAAATKVYISERGIIRDSHIISRGSQRITQNLVQTLNIEFSHAEQLKRNYGRNNEAHDNALTDAIAWVIDPLFSDIKNIISRFQLKNNKVVSKIVFVGGGSLLSGLTEKAQTKLNTEAVVGDPFLKVETPAFLADILKETGANFSVALGLALRKLQELE